jgi:hypothetical protein
MRRFWLLILVAASLAVLASACTTEPRGDREFIPGRGWEPVE